MDDSPINFEKILEQAPKWTFAGDFTLLHWMKQISQDLESRATKTAVALTKLNNNVKSTNIALDNVANRLTTLQFGNQFVECRVQDDDETLINSDDLSIDEVIQPESNATSKELLNIFLNNNLKVLRNCHERYSIDLEDSDDDETPKEKTCIYQPINPYNEKPLPYIFGSKDWQSKWHVGLYENQQDNSYSGDELSEAFSETSSTSHLEDNESFESNTEWASSNSIDNDNFNANIEVKNASTLRGPQPLYPGTPILIAKNKPATVSESSSVSTTPSSLTKNAVQTRKQNENLTQRADSVDSKSSKSSSRTTAELSAIKRENALQYEAPKQKVIDLFAEPTENAASSSVSSNQNIKRVANYQQSSRKETSPALRTQPQTFVDLFAEPPEDFSHPTTSSFSASHNIKRKVVNLFDDDDDNVILAKEEDKLEESNRLFPPATTATTSNISSISKTSKSLFEDSDDDEDFLKAFVKKSLPKEVNKNTLTKTLLFDNEVNEPTINSSSQRSSNNKEVIHVNQSRDKMDNLANPSETNNKFINTKCDVTALAPKKDNIKSVAPLLDKPDDKEEVKHTKKQHNNFSVETKTKKKINLFDDLDEEDDLFSTKPKVNKETPELIIAKKIPEKQNDNVVNTFGDVTIMKDTKESEKVIENQLKICDKPVTANAKSFDQKQIDNKSLGNKTSEDKADIETLEVDNNSHEFEKLPEPSKQDLTSIGTTIQSNEAVVVSPVEDKNQKTNSPNKFQFNSILFSDEPPEDDDAFFETLAKAPSTLNSNYNVIDLENDIFEPELPKVPVAGATIVNQTDAVDNFYAGLQLISDVPPEDDAVGCETSNPSADTHKTVKRLHSIFYDDFNETLMALNQKRIDNEIPKHSIFSDEPPAMNNNLDISSKDLTDHKVPDRNDSIDNDRQNKSYINKTETEEAFKQTNNSYSHEVSNKRPISKLQMPKFNINVQALLPGVSNTLRRSNENDKNSNLIVSANDDITSNRIITAESNSDSQLSSTTQHLTEAFRSGETEHILPNITKNRVKAPATRRPSTRRARQENYRKSLIEQQHTLSDEENGEISKAVNVENTKNLITKTAIQKQTSKDPVDQNLQEKSTSASISNQNKNQNEADIKIKDEQVHDIKNIQKETSGNTTSILNFENLPKPVLINSESLEVSSNVFQERSSLKETYKKDDLTLRSKQLNDSLFFDDDEEDDDFFKHIKPPKTADNQKPTQSKEQVLSKSFSNSGDFSTHLVTSKNMPITKEKPQLATSNNEFFNADAQNITTQGFQKQQTPEAKMSDNATTNKLKSFLDDEDDDEDLFKTAIPQPTSFLSKKERNEKAKSQFRSFLDSETEEEPNVAGLQTTGTTPGAFSENLKSETSKVPEQKVNKSKVFSDSETDSDDLFGKPKTTKNSNSKKVATEMTTKIETKTQIKSSLFGDDSDSGDDFLSSSSRSLNKTTASKISSNNNVPKITTQSNNSLFSDLDSDEDDLFGGGDVKAIATNVTNNKNLKVTPTSQTKPSAAENCQTTPIPDNPLADLL